MEGPSLPWGWISMLRNYKGSNQPGNYIQHMLIILWWFLSFLFSFFLSFFLINSFFLYCYSSFLHFFFLVSLIYSIIIYLCMHYSSICLLMMECQRGQKLMIIDIHNSIMDIHCSIVYLHNQSMYLHDTFMDLCISFMHIHNWIMDLHN